jgi:hypothetical protein
MQADDRWRNGLTFPVETKRMIDGCGAFIDR